MYKKKTTTKYQSDVLIDYIVEIFLTLIFLQICYTHNSSLQSDYDYAVLAVCFFVFILFCFVFEDALEF